MKVKVSWIILAVVLVSIAGVVGPELKHWLPSVGPSASEPAKAGQETPEATTSALFQLTDQGGEGANPNDVISDRMDYTRMFTGKNLSPEEQKFVELFWDHQRGAAIYAYLREGLATSASIQSTNVQGDSATVCVAVKVAPGHHGEWVDSSCSVELKKRGPNWYVDELKSSRAPDGVYEKFKQRVGSTP